jgi:hypothetical protein
MCTSFYKNMFFIFLGIDQGIELLDHGSSFKYLFIYIFILLLYLGYIMTFTKVLTIYLS